MLFALLLSACCPCLPSSFGPPDAEPTAPATPEGAALPTPPSGGPPPLPLADRPVHAVVGTGEAVVCRVAGGSVVDGAECPTDAEVLEVRVAPPGDGEVVLDVAHVWLRALGEEETPCTGNREVNVRTATASWRPGRAMTRLPTTSPVYVKQIGETLGVPDVQLTELVRVDLEGDGVDEVLFVADSHPGQFSWEGPYTFYSVVGVRQVGPDQKVRTVVVFEHRTTASAADHDPMGMQHGTLVGVTDVELDGKLELVVGSDYYEGSAMAVMRVGQGTHEHIGSAGCGA